MNLFKGLGDFNKKGNPPFSCKRGKIPGEKEFYRLKGTPCHFHATFRSQEKPRHPFFTIPKHRAQAKLSSPGKF
jgi:hypothetical protein